MVARDPPPGGAEETGGACPSGQSCSGVTYCFILLTVPKLSGCSVPCAISMFMKSFLYQRAAKHRRMILEMCRRKTLRVHAG